MPKVSIQKNSPLSPTDTFTKVKGLLSQDDDLKKLDPSYVCQFDDQKLNGTANGKLFKASLTVTAKGPGCSVEIVVDLPLALALAKGLVQKTLENKLNKVLS